MDDKRLLVNESEFGGPLKLMQGPTNTLSPTLRDGWDGRTLSTLTKNEPDTATDPHIALIGQITPKELKAVASLTDFQSGLLNRFIYCYTERTRDLPFGDTIPVGVFEQYVPALHDSVARAMGRDARAIPLSEPAKKRWASVYAELTSDRPGLAGLATSRGAPIVRRLAMITRCSTARRW